MSDAIILTWTIWGIAAFLVIAPSAALIAEAIDARKVPHDPATHTDPG